MKKRTTQQLKKLLFEISPKEDREKLIFKESDSLAKDIETLAQSIALLDQNREKGDKALVHMVQASIAGVREDMAETFEKHRIELETHFSEVFGKYGEYERAVEGKHTTLSTELRKEIQKQVKNLSEEIGRVNDLIPKMWGGSSRTIYLNGVPISPENMYSDVNLIPGAGITITPVNNTTTLQVDVTISASGTGSAFNAYNEIPSGPIDGGNVTFTLANTPNPSGLLMLFLNGMLQQQDGGGDYTLAGDTITFLAAPTTGDILLAWYSY